MVSLELEGEMLPLYPVGGAGGVLEGGGGGAFLFPAAFDAFAALDVDDDDDEAD